MRCRSLIAGLAATVVLWAGTGGESAGAAGGAPRVVVSIPPLHSLIAGVMAGIGEPMLLIDGASSPHAYSLRPAAARALAAAEAVFWIGPDLETFLPKPLEALAGGARVVTVMAVPDLILFPIRVGGAWEPDEDDDHAAPEETARAAAEGEAVLGHGAFDPHVWLDPRNARQIVAAAAVVLAEIDAANADTYRANAARLDGELASLEAELADRLAPVRGVPFIVFHDAYHVFEARFGLNAVGAFALTPGTAPGARRVAELRARIVESGAACVFVEPQFEPAIVRAAVTGTTARIAVLDPLGADLAPGPAAYAQLLRGLANSLVTCLGGAPR